MLDKSPETALKIFTDPFYPGDILNQLAREPEKLKVLGYENFKYFLNEHSPFSYGRSRFLMRLAAAIPAKKRAGLTSDHGELLLSMKEEGRRSFVASGFQSMESSSTLKNL